MVSLPISIPQGYAPVIKINEQITVGKVLATSNTSTKDIVLNIPRALNISPSKAKEMLLKIPGSEVKKGEKIACKKGFMGKEKIILRSKINGFVTKYNRQTGNLTIRNFSYTTDSEDIKSPVAGFVTICNNSQVVIATSTHAIIGKNSTDTTATGELFIVDGEDLFFLNTGAIGKIVAGRKLSRNMIFKAIGIGAAGMLAEQIDGMDEFAEKYPEVPLIELDAENMERIRLNRAKKIFIDGGTRSIIFLENYEKNQF